MLKEILMLLQVYCQYTAVNSHYSGHPRGRDLVSIIMRVCNSRVGESLFLLPGKGENQL